MSAVTAPRTERLQLPDGRTIRASVAEPAGVVRGGLVVLHESRGVTDAVRLVITNLAAEGWLVVAPHIYRDGPEEVDDAVARTKISELTGEALLADADVAFGWLAGHGVTADRIGVVGFELGGSVALVVAARRHIGAAVTVAGSGITEPLSAGLPALVDLASELRCPWLGLYGDKVADEVELLRAAAIRSETPTDVVLFPAADHRFDIHPDAAFEASQRMLNWFDAHLR